MEVKRGAAMWDISPDCIRVVKPIADQFGMSVEQFLDGYSGRSLPGQLTPQEAKSLAKSLHRFVLGFRFECDDPEMTRIRRAARFLNQSFPQYVMDAVIGAVRRRRRGYDH
jgi:hypothetical protein